MAQLTVIETTGDLTHVALTGRLDTTGVERVESKFTEHTAARRLPTIVEIAELDLIASIGVGMLVSAARVLREHGAAMVLLAPTESIEKILRFSSIDKVIPIAADREQALQLLGTASA